VRVGLIGCGTIARVVHLPVLLDLKGVDLLAVCDIDSFRLAEAGGLVPAARRTKTYLDILEDDQIDAVVVATHDVTHAEIVLEALRHRKHVYVEKPLTISRMDAAHVVQAALDANRVVAVGFQRLHDPIVKWLVKHLPPLERVFSIVARDFSHDNDLVLSESFPVVMRPQFLRGRADYQHDERWENYLATNCPLTGERLGDTYRLFLNLACHDLSLVTHLYGDPVEVVYSRFEHAPGMWAFAAFEMDSGVLCSLEVAQTGGPWFDQEIRVASRSDLTCARWPSPFRPDARSVGEEMHVDSLGLTVRTSYEATSFTAFKRGLADFFHAAVSGGEPLSSAAKALSVVTSLEGAICHFEASAQQAG
jgi:predicted dehydrogenase